MYHGNSVLDNFGGKDSVRDAIEQVKTSRDIIKKTGMPTQVIITDTEFKTTIYEVSHFCYNVRNYNKNKFNFLI